MKGLPQEQQDRMMDMAQKAGLNAWSSDDKYQVLKEASDLRFSAGAQDLSPTEILARTNNYQRLLGATDQDIAELNASYSRAGVIKIGRVDQEFMGAIANADGGLAVTAGPDARAAAFLGVRSIDSGVVGTGDVLRKFGEHVESSPFARYALEGLDIVSGPAIYAVRNLTPVGDLLQAATSKVAGYFADGFERAGRSEVDAANGGIGGTAMLSVGAGGFAGAIKGLRNLATDLNPIRKFDRKEITKGFQDHHIISDKNNLTKNHELLSLSGADLQARSNKIFLPKAPDSHPTRSLHDGRHTNAVSENLANQMDAVVEAGKRNGWTEQQYRKALDAITAQERALLKSGDRGLNKIARPWSN
jgi:hypothetical protein